MQRRTFLNALGALAASSPPVEAAGPRRDADPVYILVLSGGTAYGVYEAGVLSNLAQAANQSRPIVYEIVCGTSIGALNGAMFAQGRVDELVNEVWRKIGSTTVLEMPPPDRVTTATGLLNRFLNAPLRALREATDGVQGFYSADPVRDIIRQQLLAPGGASIRPFNVPLLWSYTDLERGCSGYYYQSSTTRDHLPAIASAIGGTRTNVLPAPTDPETFVEAIRASTAIPLFFEPAVPNDRLLVDGGVLNNTPFDLAILAASQLYPGTPIEIHAVLLDGPYSGERRDHLRNGFEIGLACLNAMEQRIFDGALRAAVTQRALAEAVRATGASGPSSTVAQATAPVFRSAGAIDRAHHVTVKYIRPYNRLEGSAYNFRAQDVIDRNLAAGAADIARVGWLPYQLPDDLCQFGPAATDVEREQSSRPRGRDK